MRPCVARHSCKLHKAQCGWMKEQQAQGALHPDWASAHRWIYCFSFIQIDGWEAGGEEERTARGRKRSSVGMVPVRWLLRMLRVIPTSAPWRYVRLLAASLYSGTGLCQC